MLSCEETEPELGAYLDEELNPQERAALEAHLVLCEKCNAVLNQLEFARKNLTVLPKLRASTHLAPRIAAALRTESAPVSSARASLETFAASPKLTIENNVPTEALRAPNIQLVPRRFPWPAVASGVAALVMVSLMGYVVLAPHDDTAVLGARLARKSLDEPGQSTRSESARSLEQAEKAAQTAPLVPAKVSDPELSRVTHSEDRDAARAKDKSAGLGAGAENQIAQEASPALKKADHIEAEMLLNGIPSRAREAKQPHLQNDVVAKESAAFNDEGGKPSNYSAPPPPAEEANKLDLRPKPVAPGRNNPVPRVPETSDAPANAAVVDSAATGAAAAPNTPIIKVPPPSAVTEAPVAPPKTTASAATLTRDAAPALLPPKDGALMAEKLRAPAEISGADESESRVRAAVPAKKAASAPSGGAPGAFAASPAPKGPLVIIIRTHDRVRAEAQLRDLAARFDAAIALVVVPDANAPYPGKDPSIGKGFKRHPEFTLNAAPQQRSELLNALYTLQAESVAYSYAPATPSSTPRSAQPDPNDGAHGAVVTRSAALDDAVKALDAGAAAPINVPQAQAGKPAERLTIKVELYAE